MRRTTGPIHPRALTSFVFIAALTVGTAPAARGVPQTAALVIDRAIGTMPIAVTSGDLNGDGVDDVVAASYLSNVVSVLLSTGTLGFLPRTDYVTPNQPSDVELGDFDNDGRLDLAVGCGAGQLSIRLGNGAGGFGPRTDFAANGGPRGLAIGDMNLDGKQDVVSANFGTNTVSVFLGDGAGGFAPRLDTPVSGGPHGIAIGDVFGDGIPDVVTANFFGHSATLLIGVGDGSIFHWATTPVQNTPMAVAMVDIDQDHDLDVVTANNGSGSITVLPLVPPGFGAAVHHTVGSGPADIVARVGVDGRTTLFVANYASSNVSVIRLQPTGTLYGAPLEYPTGLDPAGVTAFDADGDGSLDVVTANQNASTVSLLKLEGDGFFTAPSLLGPEHVYTPELADLNGDGRLDVATPMEAASKVRVRLGHGDGTFTLAGDFATGSSPRRVAFADLNHDGRKDMVVTKSFPGVGVFLGHGDGTFGPRSDYSTGNSTSGLAVADLNVDGHLDVIVSSEVLGTISVFPGTGTGAFGARTDYSVGASPIDLAVAHFDDDEYPDVLVANSGGSSVSVLLGHGAGLQPAVGFATGAGPNSIALGHVNDDLALDIVTANATSNNYSLLLGDGNGGMFSTTTFGFTEGNIARLADMNRDGRLDIVGPDGVMLGNGFGGFGRAASMASHWDLAIGDLSGDGLLDLVLGSASIGVTYNYVQLSRAPTRLDLTAAPLAVQGQTITLTAHLSSALAIAPGGDVRFYDGTTLLGATTLMDGIAALSVTAGKLGDRHLTAVYLGGDPATGSRSDVVVQRVVATPKPDILSLTDVRNDQGRFVRMRFVASGYDYSGSGLPITSYAIYRRVDPALGMLAAHAAGAASRRSAPRAAATVETPPELAIAGWDYVQSMPANGETSYETVVPTLADSNAAGLHRATFFVRAATATPATFYDSAPDSGHSVDNLPPAPPGPFLAAYAGGATHLHWGPNSESDLWYYAIHRGTSAGFTPGPGNLVATPADTGHVDAGPAGGYYKIAAVDLNGNGSGYALLGPGGTVGVPGGESVALALGGPRPNPARTSGFSVPFSLPSANPARLELIDVSGRRVLSREVGSLGVGRHVVDLSRGERLSAGLYMLRLTQGGASRTVRMTLLP